MYMFGQNDVSGAEFNRNQFRRFGTETWSLERHTSVGVWPQHYEFIWCTLFVDHIYIFFVYKDAQSERI
jgi:hypothetical protein